MAALERMGALGMDDEDMLRATVRLNTPEGKKLWAGNFQRSVRSVAGVDLARVRAKDLMKKFMRDYHNAQYMSEVDFGEDDNDYRL